MTVDEPPYLGSWKGLILKAIVINNIHTWNELRQETNLSPNNLNTALSELYRLGLLKKLENGRYWVNETIYRQYQSFFGQQESFPQPLGLFDGEPVMYIEQATTSLSDLTNGYDTLRATFTKEQTRLADQINVSGQLEQLITITQKQTDLMAEQNKQNQETLVEVKQEAKNNRRNYFIALAVAVFEAFVTFIALFR